MPTALLTHPDCALHEMGDGHPESPERLRSVMAALESSGFAKRLLVREAPAAEREHLERVHHPDLVGAGLQHRAGKGLRVPRSRHVDEPEIALRRAARGRAVVKATDMVMSGEADSAFCAVRPPGHHATRDRAMGFCMFNNVAIGALQAHRGARARARGVPRLRRAPRQRHRRTRSTTIPRVMLCSTFQHPVLPVPGRRIRATTTSSTCRCPR
jgi:acetoin utilization deacetylase AcuC-like enzyme